MAIPMKPFTRRLAGSQIDSASATLPMPTFGAVSATAPSPFRHRRPLAEQAPDEATERADLVRGIDALVRRGLPDTPHFNLLGLRDRIARGDISILDAEWAIAMETQFLARAQGAGGPTPLSSPTTDPELYAQVTRAGEAGAGLGDSVVPRQFYDPHEAGHHYYIAGPTVVCSAPLACTPEEIAYYLARYAYPGQDPAEPIVDGEKYTALDPTGLFGGPIRSDITTGGLSIVNTTLPGHVFHDGQIVRTALRTSDGDWVVVTNGFGVNIGWPRGLRAQINEGAGRGLFEDMDRQMANNIAAHHGVPLPYR